MATTVIDGITIKDFIMKSLLKKSIRECMKDEKFLKQTQIKTKYELEKIISNYRITQEEIYNYGKINSLIPKTMTIENFINSRKSGSYYADSKTFVEKFAHTEETMINKKQMIEELISKGYYADDTMTINSVKSLYDILIKED